MVILLSFFGCSTVLDTQYESSHIPPGETKTYKSPSQAYGKKRGTQKPYKIKGVQYFPLASAGGFVQTGIASWYGGKFHGRKTSNGETYNMYAMTAAHKTLPVNTWVRVHNLENNREIVVRINDRGPFIRGRIIDLSYKGAQKIGIVRSGTAKVKITALGEASSYSKETSRPLSFKPVDYWKGNFTVQVGAFKVKTNAIKYRDKLSKTYQNAHIVTYRDDRGIFYRVRIGRFTNVNDAARFSAKISEKGFTNAFEVAE